MSALRKAIVAQFRRPSGPVGALAGRIMASRPSNRLRNAWTIGLLAPMSGETLLEIGCGPGLALEMAAIRAPGVALTGLDHSEVMLAQARRRLEPRQSAELVCGRYQTMAEWPERFDGVFSVNVAQFFDDMDEAYRLTFAALKPGGRTATTYQPRHKNPTAEDARRMGLRIQEAMKKAGFDETGLHELPLDPVMAVAVTGKRTA